MTVAIVRQRSLFGVVVLTTIYSFLMASVLIVLDAVDVAMTEASVGAGISTVILLATLHLDKDDRDALGAAASARVVRSRSAPVPSWSGARSRCRPSAPLTSIINKHVVPRYLADTIKETNVPNVVTSVLADYRGYDTLGETTVIFTAGIGVMLLLRGSRRRGPQGRGERTAMSLDLILRIGTKLILPFILLFALYVQFHGDYGPGGGFQAGVITAGMVILLAITFGLDAAQRIAPQALVERMIPLGVLIYAGTGIAGLAAGQELSRLFGRWPATPRTATSSESFSSRRACWSPCPAP